jgi:tRNA nucleotidyltransferase (CCA-adding enzyme)
VPQPEQHHPEIDTGVHVMMVVDRAARCGYSLPVRFAALTHDLGKGETPPAEWPRHHGHEAHSVTLVERACKRLRIPNDCRDLALMTARDHGNVGRALELRADTIVSLLERCDAFRKPHRFVGMLQAAECDFKGRAGFEERPFPQKAFLEGALTAAQAVDAGAIAQEAARRYPDRPERIPEEIRRARIAAVSSYRDSNKPASSLS